jgi:hypothetical protein
VLRALYEVLNMKLRVISTVFIAFTALLFTVYMTYQWCIHGMPIYTAAYKHGSKPEILPFLGLAIISGLVFCVALADFYIHAFGNSGHGKELIKNEKKGKKNSKRSS